jgi:hypothetical protein
MTMRENSSVEGRRRSWNPYRSAAMSGNLMVMTERIYYFGRLHSVFDVAFEAVELCRLRVINVPDLQGFPRRCAHSFDLQRFAVILDHFALWRTGAYLGELCGKIGAAVKPLFQRARLYGPRSLQPATVAVEGGEPGVYERALSPTGTS